MKELFESCKKLILDNYKGHINDSSLEAMTIAVMALCLKNEKRTVDKLPKILQNIEIFAEDKSVLEIAKNNISTFSDEMVDGNIGACVIRGFGTDDDTGEIYEEKCLVVSTVNLNDNPSDVIMKITHELTHLLRDQKFGADGKSIKTKNGISIVRVRDLSTGEKKMLNNAKQILVSELVLAEHASKEEVETLIDNKITMSFEEYKMPEAEISNEIGKDIVKKFIPFDGADSEED